MANEKRLIDANELVRFCENEIDKYENGLNKYERDYVKAICVVKKIARTFPTVDAVEVVHGRWERVIPTKSAAKWSIKVSCSVCHRQGYTHHKYCPHCGAKMDGDWNG